MFNFDNNSPSSLRSRTGSWIQKNFLLFCVLAVIGSIVILKNLSLFGFAAFIFIAYWIFPLVRSGYRTHKAKKGQYIQPHNDFHTMPHPRQPYYEDQFGAPRTPEPWEWEQNHNSASQNPYNNKPFGPDGR